MKKTFATNELRSRNYPWTTQEAASMLPEINRNPISEKKLHIFKLLNLMSCKRSVECNIMLKFITALKIHHNFEVFYSMILILWQPCFCTCLQALFMFKFEICKIYKIGRIFASEESKITM